MILGIRRSVLAGLLGTLLLSFSQTVTMNPDGKLVAHAAAVAAALGTYLMGLYTAKPGQSSGTAKPKP